MFSLSCCSPIFYISPLLTLMTLSQLTFYCGLVIFIFFSAWIYIFHIFLHDLFFFLNNNVFIVICKFKHIFLGAFKTGWFTCFLYVLVCLYALPGYVFNPIFHCQCLITCHTRRLILFLGGSRICDFHSFIFIIDVTLLF